MSDTDELVRLDLALAEARAVNKSLEDVAFRSRCDLVDEQTRSDKLRAALREALDIAEYAKPGDCDAARIAELRKLAGNP